MTPPKAGPAAPKSAKPKAKAAKPSVVTLAAPPVDDGTPQISGLGVYLTDGRRFELTLVGSSLDKVKKKDLKLEFHNFKIKVHKVTAHSGGDVLLVEATAKADPTGPPATGSDMTVTVDGSSSPPTQVPVVVGD